MLCLTRPTNPAWADIALADLPALLVDHAHCEMKAASNALSLATRTGIPIKVAAALADLAEEELRHFRAVLDLLAERGITLAAPEVDTYAAELRRRSASGGARPPAVSFADRLLVGALIEARSCERFHLLAEALAARGDALAPFYRELFACEARHYTMLVDLAADISGDPRAVRERLSELAAIEGEIAASLGTRGTMHG